MVNYLSVTSWFTLSDAGIANSLRNKLSKLLAKNNIVDSNVLISSTYKYFFFLLSIILALLIIIICNVNLNLLFNVSIGSSLTPIVIFSICAVMTNVYFMLNSAVFFALDKPAYDAKKLFLFQLLFVLLCFCLEYSEADFQNSLYFCALAYFFSAFVTNILGYMYLSWCAPDLSPKFQKVNAAPFRSLIKVGGQFLLLQLASIALYSTDAFLIAHLFDISSVTSYNLTNKIFFIFIFFQGALLSPMWSRYTHLYEKKDNVGLKNQLKSSLLLTFVLIVLMLPIVYNINYILEIWIGVEGINVETVAIALLILTSLRLWSSNFSTLLNGIGDLKAQLIAAVCALVINIPLSIILVKFFDYGLEGVAYASVVALMIFGVIGPFRVYKTLAGLKP